MASRINSHTKVLLLMASCALGTFFTAGLSSDAFQQAQQQEKHADPHAAIRANNLGAAYLNQQRMEQALAQFKQAQSADPKLAAARVNEAIALLNLQRIEPARALLGEIVAQEPRNIRAWYNLGLLEKNSGDAEKALAAFERAASLDPDDPDTHYFIGTLHSQLQKYDAAIAAFQRAIQLNPFHVSAEFGLARTQQRLGNAEQARLHLARFQHLNTEKLGAPMSLAYGDQGQYSLAETVTPHQSASPPAMPVRFEARPPDDQVMGEQGGKFVAGDYDNDGKMDNAGIVLGGRLNLYRGIGGGRTENVTLAAGIRQSDVVFGNILFLDFDHDGDLDLYVTSCRVWKSGWNRASQDPDDIRQNTRLQNVLWRNDGDGTFTDWSEESGLDGSTFGFGPLVVAADFNNDRAVDLLVAPVPTLLVNRREGPFLVSRPWSSFPASPLSSVAVLDLNNDGWMDVAFGHKDRPGITIWRNESGRDFHPIHAPSISNSASLIRADYDNDGWQDLVVFSKEAQTGRLFALRNETSGVFRDASDAVGLDKVQITQPTAFYAYDYDGDGDVDFAVNRHWKASHSFQNIGGNKNNWLKLSLKGLADNKSAIGTKVEVFAGASYQKFEVTTPNDLLIGLGQEKQADVVRLLWPTGVLQDEVNLAANQRHEIAQIDRRGSSCPVLFAWNGSRYEFIADAIGPGIVGHWVAPGLRNTSDPTEYIKVPGSLLRERRGPRGERLLSFRFAEPMEEIVYLDQLRLFAIDHPSGTDVNPSERFFASGPPFPTGAPVFTQHSNARPPVSARDHRGRDVTALLRARDRRYVSDFTDAPYKGFAELHWIELDLGEAAQTTAQDPVGAPLAAPLDAAHPRGFGVRRLDAALPSRHGQTNGAQQAAPLRLLLRGYTDYFTATSVYAAHQGGMTAIVPYVEALTPQGKWVRVADDMGFPAGLARTMVADLTGKLPPGTQRIRIATNLKIYWDQILIDTTPEGTPHRASEAPLAAARAGYLGYPREIRGTPASDIRYDYHTVSATGPYARATGLYTRYGDVRALVVGADDRFVLMGSGDEVAVDFDAAALPPVPEGWTRDWFFYVDGFAKDMDFYAAHPFTVTPLPYHAMPGYPYSDEHRYPNHGPHLEDQLELNTRAVSGRPAPSYRYAYPK